MITFAIFFAALAVMSWTAASLAAGPRAASRQVAGGPAGWQPAFHWGSAR